MGELSIFQDVSEYESLADQLAAYEKLSEQQDVIIESFCDGLWISDAEGKVVRAMLQVRAQALGEQGEVGARYFGVQADIVTSTKSLGGGPPLSAVTGKADIMDSVIRAVWAVPMATIR